MLGWEFYIYRHDLAPDPRQITPDDRALLARWLVSLGGLDWISNLVRDGKATDLSVTEYPLTYLAKASDVLPLIAHGPPKYEGSLVVGDDYEHPTGWTGDVSIHHDRIAACHPDLILLIHAWDQS
jgi:hypothetical protein